MPESWIPITIAAAFFQNIRSALQKHLQGRLSVAGAAYARFVYALPPVALYVWALQHGSDGGGGGLPAPNATFFLYCLLGGASQIAFTALLLWLFSFRSFAVGTTFSKLEVVMVALLGAWLLGDALSATAVLAIAVSALGAIALGAARSDLRAVTLRGALAQKPAIIGIACAACLGASTVFFRGAALALGHERVVMAAGYTLFIALLMQTALMGVFIALTERGELARVWRNWRRGGAVGIAGALASICWFTAFTLHNAAHVRALGQIELLFTFLVTTLVFKEKVTRAEWSSIALVIGGILLLLLSGAAAG
ncbi:MAG: EamA family transporter [Gammaproteobacteria bacterium]